MADSKRVCWTLGASSPDRAVALARGLIPLSARFVELRIDYFDTPSQGPDAVRALRSLRVPVIATLRTALAGGRFAGTVQQQLSILTACAEAGATIVDMEMESAERLGTPALRRIRRHSRLLLSFHDYHQTPPDVQAVLRRLRSYPADYYKVVTTAARHADNARLLELNKRRSRTLAFALGDIGAPTRILSLARGAPFTYAAPAAAAAVAPGQIAGNELLGTYRAEKLSPRTAIYGVIGNPIAHSISPAVHNAAFASTRRDAVYLPFRVELLADFLSTLESYRLAGFSVTIPHKEEMARLADWIEPQAREVGAVNTIVVRGGKLRAHNTDLAGVTVPLGRRMHLPGARILVAGTGGAARAAAFALSRKKARVAVTGRRPEVAAALAQQVGGVMIERNRLSAESFDAIVHATSLGMHPDTEGCFFSAGELNAPLLFETVYTPAETRLMRLARGRGMQVIPGLEMFLEQAARQFELWTGRKAPRDVMQRAAQQALGGQRATASK